MRRGCSRSRHLNWTHCRKKWVRLSWPQQTGSLSSLCPGDQPAGGAAVPQGRGRREALPHTGVPAQTVRQEDPLQHERFREGGTEGY